MFYAIADAAALGFAIEPGEARDLSLAGERIRAAAREQLPCAHPENPAIHDVSIVQIAAPWQGVGAVTRNAVVVAPGRLDRSPTGTGLCARMAVLHARGLMRPGDAMSHASVIGSVFDGRIVSAARVGEHEGIVPAVRGSAWITGLHQYLVDPSDPFPEGYLVADTWGVSGGDTQGEPQPATAASTPWPYFASLFSPTPLIVASSARLAGACVATSRSVASWKIT